MLKAVNSNVKPIVGTVRNVTIRVEESGKNYSRNPYKLKIFY